MALPVGTHTGRVGISSYPASGDQAAGADFAAERSIDRNLAAGLLSLLGGECQFSGTQLSTGDEVPAGEWLILDDSGYPLYVKTTSASQIIFGAASGSQDLYAALDVEGGVSPDRATGDLDGVGFATVPTGNPAPSDHAFLLGTGAVTASSFTSFTYAEGAYRESISEHLPDVDITVGAEGGNQIQVTVQVREYSGEDLDGLITAQALSFCWLSDSTLGAETTIAPNVGGRPGWVRWFLRSLPTFPGSSWPTPRDSSGLILTRVGPRHFI